jgi:hypothetical protein
LLGSVRQALRPEIVAQALAWASAKRRDDVGAWISEEILAASNVPALL